MFEISAKQRNILQSIAWTIGALSVALLVVAGFFYIEKSTHLHEPRIEEFLQK